MAHLVFVEFSGLGVQSIEYAKDLGHTVTLIRSPAYDFMNPPEVRAHAEALADRTLRLPDLHDIGAMAAALSAAGVVPGGVDAVSSTLSLCAYPAAQLAEKLGAAGTPAQAVADAQDKGRCREILRDAGVPSLDFAVVRDLDAALEAAAAIGYPAVVKPVAGVGKAAMAIVAGPEELRAFFAGLPEQFRRIRETQPGLASHLDDRFIVEEVAVGELYSVEYAADRNGDGAPLISVGRKMGRDNPVLELGCTVPSGLDAAEEDELGRYAGEVCRALGLAPGIFHIEAMLTDRGFRLIEANPRISGGSLPDSVALATGRNIFHLLVDIVLGDLIAPRALAATTAASHSFLAAARDAVIPAKLPADWFEQEIRPLIHSGWFRSEPGTEVAGMRTNWDSFGLIRITGADAAQADAECARIRRLVERRLGFDLTPIGATRRGRH